MAKRILGDRVFEVYRHTNTINGKSYIGITSTGVQNRLYAHESCAKHGSTLPFHRAIRRYGMESFETTVIASCLGVDAANEVEKLMILEFGTFGRGGYNATAGGDGTSGRTHSVARRKAISEQMRNLVRTDQHKARISAALKGKPKTPEAIEAATKRKRGRKQDLVKKAWSLAGLEKARLAWTGGAHTDDAKAAMRKTKSRPIVIEWPDGSKDERVTTLRALASEYGISAAALSQAVRFGRTIRYHQAMKGCRLSCP